MSDHFQTRPHHVYLHLDDMDRIIYEGCTQNPERPTDDDHGQRPWLHDETARVVVSPAMTYEAAAWTEQVLIAGVKPRHNHLSGRHIEPDLDGRIKRLCEVANVPRGRAQSVMRGWPRDLSDEDFEQCVQNYASAVASIQGSLAEERKREAAKRRARKALRKAS